MAPRARGPVRWSALDWASMRNRRIICFLMGTWIGVSAMLALSIYRNFDAVDAALKSPPEQAGRILRALGPDSARMLLRYTAGIENSEIFDTWEDIQAALGLLIAVVMFLSPSTRVLSVVPLVMTLLVLFLHLRINPDLTWLGRSLEFTPLAVDSPQREQFWRLHRIYAILESVKCLLGLGVTAILVMQGSTKVVKRRRRHEPAEGDLSHRAALR